MNQCQAKKADGTRCRRQIKKGVRFCGHHQGTRLDVKRAAMVGAGVLVGNALAPGLGGMVFGALVGGLIDHVGLMATAKRRVFLSFDYSHDRRMKTLFVGQAKLDKSPFTIIDSSLIEAAPEPEWIEHAAAAISKAELVVVLIGEHTSKATGVLIEIDLAKQLGRPVVQVWAYNDRRGQPISGVRGPFLWDWEVLRHILD